MLASNCNEEKVALDSNSDRHRGGQVEQRGKQRLAVKSIITMSTESDTQTEAQLEEINQVGDVRRKNLRGEGYVNAGDVAMADPEELYEKISGLSKGDAERIVNNARQLIGAEPTARIERDDHEGGHNFPMDTLPAETTAQQSDEDEQNQTPEKYLPDDEDDEDLVDESPSIDELRESIPDPEPKPEECEKVLFIGGQGAFGFNGKYSDLDGEEQSQLILQRINEFGFTNVEKAGLLESGMCRNAVASWLAIQDEKGNKVPDPEVFATRDDLSGKEAYDDRDERAIEWADGICVIANGEFVGKWVNMTRDTSTIIRTPDRDDEEDDADDDEESEE